MTSRSKLLGRESRHFCMLPWIFAQVSQDGAVRPCCFIDEGFTYGSLHENKFTEIWNGEKIRSLRLHMLKDLPFKGCEGCYSHEKLGGSSFRQETNRDFSNEAKRLDETDDQGALPMERTPLMLDFRFSNLCNFRCRTCSPYDSTAWIPDAKHLLGPDVSVPVFEALDLEEVWKVAQPNLSQLKRLYILGGEPLLHLDHFLFLERLIAAGRTDIPIRYNTNLSVLGLKDRNIFDLWNRFENIHLNLSFDGTGRALEVIRKGSRWNEIFENFKKVRKLSPRVSYSVYSTVSALNVFHLPEAIEEWLKLGLIEKPEHFKATLVERPKHYSIQILNEGERESVIARYEAFFSWLRVSQTPTLSEAIICELRLILDSFGSDFFGPEKELYRAMFRKVTFQLDHLRKERLVTALPELLDLLYSRS
jgi:MoaA/NifB/PqqE/SkfB family radical SAM enzyme